ncbi:2Fe-2S iron-sulfur cluster binding domain-containing protein [Solimonas flava]|jgi:ferredoxin|uniref:Ferredoxin n=1 Tax=uncultured bacterium UPO41 TaxID=1776966 RepID=A0A126SXU1_9BACT|nr:2Fe-2S iron-sulfur cluster binding domain-containing protein [Solimonas flava]AMK59113.1 ferredoxin [uncultured bacterium UPO41]
MRFEVLIDGNGNAFHCATDQPVLSAMTNTNQRGIQVGCRSGGCGVCRVRVLSGRYRLGQMSNTQAPKDQVDLGFVLACRLYPESDLRIVPVGRLVAVAADAISRGCPSRRPDETTEPSVR